jgi:hypothetical protein
MSICNLKFDKKMPYLLLKFKAYYHKYLLQPYQSLTIYWGEALDVVYYQALLFPLQAIYTVVFNIEALLAMLLQTVKKAFEL